MKIWFDMDGTIANLYGVDNWLEMLINEDVAPYRDAETLLNMNSLTRILNRLTRQGYELGVISWLSKSGSDAYNEAVTAVKLHWLRVHLASVTFNTIHIVPYGTDKDTFRESALDVLFDDEARNREAWGGVAYDVDAIIDTLKQF